MPIFEFECKKCNHQFEQLFLSADDRTKPECPKCGARKAQKLISAGSVRPNGIPTGAGGFKAPACSPSGRG